MAWNFHEDLKRSARVHGSSDRNFGLVFAAFFTLVGSWPLHARGHVRVPALVVAGVFLAVALIRPSWLAPLNKAWAFVGLLLGRIFNPIVTAVLFYRVLTPMGFISQLARQDAL